MIQTPEMSNVKQDISEIGRAWWQALSPGERATLRRCHTLEEIAFESAFHRLRRDLVPFHMRGQKVALIAGVLAHIKEDDVNAFATKLAKGKEGSTVPTFSERRFKQLLRVKTPEKLLDSLTRAIKILSHASNVGDLTWGIFRWPRVRKDWAIAYYDQILIQTTE